jgi:opacity protein-like surface antigen
MKNILTAAFLTMAVSAASAASLPEKKATPTAPAVEAPSSWYVGVNAGGNVRSNQNVQNTPGDVGGVVGYKVAPGFNIEATLEQAFKKGRDGKEQRAMINGVVESPFAYFGFKPYVLAGIGAQEKDIKNGLSGTKTVYNVGGGVKYEINKSWDLDTRYRYVNTLNNTNRDSNVVTVGVNYKF